MEQQQNFQNYQEYQQYQNLRRSENNLNTLVVLHYVKAGLNVLAILFFALYIGLGLFMSNTMSHEIGNDLQYFPAKIFITIGIVGVFICVIVGILDLLAAKYIKQRKNHTFIIVVAAIHCISGLLGIGIGIFTIIELTKPEVKRLFDSKEV
jgi:ABC-type Fe3+ transport system permease subunit